VAVPRQVFPTLIGNKRLSAIVGGDILADRLGHAYILEGAPGSGKHTAAKLISAALSCENRKSSAHSLPCGQCLVCRKTESGVSPDLLIFGREEGRATIGVETIRQLRENLWIAPNENEKKVYVIEEADTMTPQAQNALLLSLEEPPPFVVFLLLVGNADALLETIRSRAPVLRMELFAPETVAELLKKDSRFEALSRTDPDFFSEAIAGSAGALGQARRLLSRADEDSAAYLSQRADALQMVSLLFTPDPPRAAKLLASLPKAREDTVHLLELVVLALRDMAAVKKGSAVPLSLYLNREECRPIADKVSISRIVHAYTDTFTAIQDILSNVSVLPVCTALLAKKH